MSKPRPASKASPKPAAAKPKRASVPARKKPPRASAKQEQVKHAAIIAGWVLLALFALSGVCASFGLWYLSRGLPSADALRRYEPAQTTRVVDRNGQLLAESFTERRTLVPMARVPRVLVLSVLAAEDADFYHHAGMDLPSMLRVLYKAVVHGRATQGGSTITQQVVKNLLLTPEKTLERKLKELILARRLEQELSKDEILSLYLNDINFGHGRYGVQEAAHYYFDKNVEELNLAEASLIAGIPQSPSRLSPRTHLEAARRRQMFVLDQLEAKRSLYWDDLSLADIDAARKAEPALAPTPISSDRAPEVAQMVRQVLVDAVGEQAAARGGYTVVTTLDLDLQEAARRAVWNGLHAVDVRQGKRAPLQGPHLGEKALAQLARSAKPDAPTRGTLAVGRTYDAVILGAEDAEHVKLAILSSRAEDPRASTEGTLGRAEVMSMRRFNPDRLAAGAFARAGVKVRAVVMAMPEGAPVEAKLALGPEAAALVVDARSREVRAMVGGYEVVHGFNRAVQALRQPGSSFKPVVYGLALQSRRFTPATMVIDAPGAYDKYKPANYETWTYEGSVRLRHGLAQSINSVAVRVIDQLGPQPVVDFARKLGITSPLDPSLALALGASEVRMSELVNAYTTFAAGGRFAPLSVVKRITDSSGKEIKLKVGEPPRDVMTPAEAYVLTSMMTSVVEEGTATRAKVLARPAAGKTGTSNQARDAWFVGYTASTVAGVWVGFDDHRPLGARESGAKSALPIWIDVMRAAHGDAPPEPFPMPAGVVGMRIDPKSGLLAYEGQPDAIDDVFLEGTEPQQVALPPDVADANTFMMEQLASPAPR